MQVREMFRKPIDREIQGVIIVGQGEETNVSQELDEYVVTRELQKHFADFFSAYKKGILGTTPKMGVWISGFFGSGKSHFLKILSYLLENKQVGDRRALDFFVEDKKIADPMVLADMKLAAETPTDVVLFNIDSKSDTGSKQNKDAIVNVFLRVFNEMQGFCGSLPHLADLEQQLTEAGRMDEFKEAFEDEYGKPWEENRHKFDFIQDTVVDVLVDMDFMSESAARNWCEKASEPYQISIEDFAKRVKAYINAKGKNHHVVFLVDEIGQYIGEDSKLMLNLQTVTEELGKECQGKAWVIVTSQQDIDSVTKVKGNDFSKIQGRFDTRLSLSSANVDAVIKKRILDKTDTAAQTLRLLYDQKATIIKNLIVFNDGVEKKLYANASDFSEVYPFVPYQFNLLASVLTSIRTHGASGKHLSEGERSMLALFKESAAKLKDEEMGVINKLDEVFRLLFIKQCNALNEILPALFEKTNDYTELLLNLSVIDQDGVVYHLVHDIPEEDFDVERGGQVEIIGWLYQYYNTEPKNEAFAKKGKITKEEVPAVTQLFTPDWIVRYMVENSLGRLWLEGHPNEDLKADWKYYLEEAEQEPEVQTQLVEIRAEYARLNPEDIKIIDPCMGSGHILVYAFDVLMQIYESAGYGQRDAARSILENNLYGLDIDDRAFQMAYFAIMMKARQYNRRILNGDYRPNLFSIQESNDINRNHLKYFGNGMPEEKRKTANLQINYLFDTFKDAKEFGSLLSVKECDWDLLQKYIVSLDVDGQLDFDSFGTEETSEALGMIIKQARCMSAQYDIAVTNPPYMGSPNMSSKLLNFIKKQYPRTKADLFAAFIERNIKYVKRDRYVSMITQSAWMFQSRFESTRELLREFSLVNMAHLGTRAFDSISGEVVQTTTFSLIKHSYSRCPLSLFGDLTEGKSEAEKEALYFLGDNWKKMRISDFCDIPGMPIAYYASENALKCFKTGVPMKQVLIPKQGTSTGNDDKYVRSWYEVDIDDIEFSASSKEEFFESGKKYVPLDKGGEYRKWYGNNERIIRFDEKSYNELLDMGNHLPSRQYYFLPGITWSKIASELSVRYDPKGFVFSSVGLKGFPSSDKMNELLGFMNSKVCRYFVKMLSPGMSIVSGDIEKIPYISSSEKADEINTLVQENIELSKAEWDESELSWDFAFHPLCVGHSLEDSFQRWRQICTERIRKVKENEEELDRLFAQIYGMGDEIDINTNDVTLSNIDKQDAVKSFLSYAVGCMFGRYSIDYKGVVCAGRNFNRSNYMSFIPDDDNVIPITDEEYLEDDIVTRLCSLLKKLFPDTSLEKNLDFLASGLNNKGNSTREKIRNYYLNDFYGDHCKKYSKRPIYWLFDSGKSNGFKALVYLFRHDENTIGNLRVDYLHRLERIYESEISRMDDLISHSTSNREVSVAARRKEKLQKQIKECKEYDEKISHLALSRRTLDFNDGILTNYESIQTSIDNRKYNVLAKIK